MSKIFVRERRHVGKGAGRPRFAVVAVEGTELNVLAPHLRKVELETLSSSMSAEIVYLPRGESADQSVDEGGHDKRRGKGWKKRQG